MNEPQQRRPWQKGTFGRRIDEDESGSAHTATGSPANEQERAWVGELAESVQQTTDESVELAYVDEDYTGERPASEAETHGMSLEVFMDPEAKRGSVLLPRRWVVECDFASRGFVRHRDSGDWRRITRGCPLLWLGCASPPASSSVRRSVFSARVHDTL